MKKNIVLITLILIFLFPLKAYANTTSVEINVDGNIKKGEEINILINMKGLENLYAASVNFTYDKSVLNIVSITAGDSIKKYADEIMEIGGEVDTTNNKTSYSFTFLGDKEGINGDGTLAIIKAEVLKDGDLLIGQDSMNIKLVKRVGDSVENYDYKFIGYSTENNTDNVEDKVEIGNNNNEEENNFWDNILNGNKVENIINNIKNFISGNSNVDRSNEEDISNENANNVDVDKEDINKEENNVDKQVRHNIYIYFIGAISIVVAIYGIYKLKNDK